MGRTTGRSDGALAFSCVNLNVAGTDITMICQEAARATVDPGDSGSPVFMVTNDPAIHDVRLAGILWGETNDTAGSELFVYSSIGSVQRELGTLANCHPNFIC